MIKKYQKCYMYATYQRHFFKQLLKKTFKPTKKNPKMKKTCVDQVINVVQLLVQSHEETYCCC